MYETIIHQSEREKWLDERRKSIGASDCPAILGLTSWGSPTSVQADKHGLLPEVDQVAGGWGGRFEAPIIEAFADESGLKAVPFGSLIRNPEYPFLHATPDGYIPRDEQTSEPRVTAFVQAKWTVYKASEWDDGIPEDVVAQQQHEMIVSGHPYCYVAALAGHKLKWAKLERDETFIASWLEIAEDFWGRTQAHEAIVNDGDEATQKALNAMYKRSTGGYKNVGAEWCEIDEELLTATETRKAAEKHEKKLKAQIRAEIGDAEGILLPGGVSHYVTRSDLEAHTVKAYTRIQLRRRAR